MQSILSPPLKKSHLRIGDGRRGSLLAHLASGSQLQPQDDSKDVENGCHFFFFSIFPPCPSPLAWALSQLITGRKISEGETPSSPLQGSGSMQKMQEICGENPSSSGTLEG